MKLNEEVAVMKRDIQYIREKQEEHSQAQRELNDKMSEFIKAADNKYATKEEIEPMRKVVYGAIGIILIAFIGGIIAFVFR